jgi:hypothetical protein
MEDIQEDNDTQKVKVFKNPGYTFPRIKWVGGYHILRALTEMALEIRYMDDLKLSWVRTIDLARSRNDMDRVTAQSRALVVRVARH